MFSSHIFLSLLLLVFVKFNCNWKHDFNRSFTGSFRIKLLCFRLTQNFVIGDDNMIILIVYFSYNNFSPGLCYDFSV